MTITINQTKPIPAEKQAAPVTTTVEPLASTPATTSTSPAEVVTPPSTDQPRHQTSKPNKGHSRPLDIQGIDLNTPQRLLAGHVMAFLKTSHSTLARWIDEGKFPAPDGHQGRRPYWFASTIRPHVG